MIGLKDIFVGERLIVTYETSKNVLNTRDVERIAVSNICNGLTNVEKYYIIIEKNIFPLECLRKW